MFAFPRNLPRSVSHLPTSQIFTVALRRSHHFSQYIQDFASTLQQTQPCFAVAPQKVQILSEPTQFYTMLLDMIRRARRRIFISSLYIGSGEHELVEELRTALNSSTTLQLYLQLDLNRSTRPGNTSTAHLLLPLLQEFPSRVHVSLFRSPSLRGILAKLVPPRFNEGWGTWHAKIYGVDDEVMISGANLNRSYFTNRQDRYLHFMETPDLAQYCFSFLRKVSTFSYRLLPLEASTMTSSPYSYQHEDYTLHWPDPGTHPHHIHRKAQTSLTTFQKTHLLRSSSSDKILVFPVIQAGQFNIREEESSLAFLFRLLSYQPASGINHKVIENASESSIRRPLLDLTSGYFGLYKPYQDLILTCPNLDCRIVAASPTANGFFGSKGISGRIPEGYTYLEQRFMMDVERAGRRWIGPNTMDFGSHHAERCTEVNMMEGEGIQLNEWQKDGWTYHAKGIWLSPDRSSPPGLTLFGSTNLNSRSAHLDTELSFFMVFPSVASDWTHHRTSEQLTTTLGDDVQSESMTAMTLRRKLADEVSNLRAQSHDWTGDTRGVRWGTKLIVKLVEGML